MTTCLRMKTLCHAHKETIFVWPLSRDTIVNLRFLNTLTFHKQFSPRLRLNLFFRFLFLSLVLMAAQLPFFI